jgi:hypothetical protein
VEQQDGQERESIFGLAKAAREQAQETVGRARERRWYWQTEHERDAFASALRGSHTGPADAAGRR